MANGSYKLPRGMKDLSNDDARKFDFIVKVASDLAEEMNFTHLTTPIIEYSNLFDRNLGEESDVVKKELYRFEDKSGDMLAMRPEMTAGVCRHVIENGLFQGPFPHKFFSFGPVFRYDRPQKGRYRQFNQLNFEIFGLKERTSEIYQYLMFVQKLLLNIGINSFVIKINYLGGKDERKEYTNALYKYLQQYKQDLSEDSKIRLEKNILRILDSKDEGDKNILKQAPKIEDFLNDENKKFLYSFVETDKEKHNFFEEFKNNNTNSLVKGDNIQIDSNLVRGLDYYSGFVFEIVTNKLGATQDAICGGGEYNNLIEEMSRKKLNAFGWALGIERLMELMDETNVPNKKPLYCHLTNKSNLIKGARNEINYNIDFVKGLKWANQIKADFVIFEKDGKIFVKDLKSGEQELLEHFQK